MKKIVIATHGRLADGYLSSLGLLGVDLSHVMALGFYDESGADPEAVGACFEQLAAGDQLVVCSDVSFGSVSQMFAREAAKHPECDCLLVSGINLPLMLELSLSADPVDTASLAEAVVQARQQLAIVEVPAIDAVSAEAADPRGGADSFF